MRPDISGPAAVVQPAPTRWLRTAGRAASIAAAEPGVEASIAAAGPQCWGGSSTREMGEDPQPAIGEAWHDPVPSH